ncbi:MAG: Mitochondrial import inner membrane translocase subunit tim8 [Thelocarpon superellum]|nr:MAG: Mitochondrial import inner membrane translocase subunit tim8 [Thelocarpon superellum]
MDTSALNQHAGLSKLPEKDKQELLQFLVNESQKAKIQRAIHSLTETCWKKCITGGITRGGLEKGEESCTQNCVDRFMDAHLNTLKHLESMRQSGGS